MSFRTEAFRAQALIWSRSGRSSKKQMFSAMVPAKSWSGSDVDVSLDDDVVTGSELVDVESDDEDELEDDDDDDEDEDEEGDGSVSTGGSPSG